MYQSSMYPSGKNPSELPCFSLCSSCYRCEDKGKYARCSQCSGRHDPHKVRDPYYIDDRCRCKEGVLQYLTKQGRMVLRRFLTNPFAGKVITDAESEDERDWNQYVAEKREQLDNSAWDPIQFSDGSSVDAWLKEYKRGK